MKSYDEVAKRVLERRDSHNIAVAKRNRIAVRVGLPVVSLCLAAMVGVGFREYGKISEPPALVDDAVIPGIDDTVDPWETDVEASHKYDGEIVPGGAIVSDEVKPETKPAIEIGTAAVDAPADEPTKDTGKRQDECPEGGDAIWIEPHWNEKEIGQKFPEFELDGITYVTGSVWTDSDKIGTLLGSITAHGYDTYEEKSYEIGITVYSINGISTDAAVAVEYDGYEGQYAVYCNHWYKPETLGEFIDALNLRENLTFGTIYHTYWEYESYITVEYKISDESVIWDMLLSDGSLVNVTDDVTDKEMSFYKEGMSIAVNVDILGVKNVSLTVTENGYINTNILATRKLFYIGEEKAAEFFEYVEKNFEGVREEYAATTTAAEPYYPDDTVATAVTQISPPYDPSEDLAVAETVPAYDPTTEEVAVEIWIEE